MIGIVLVAGGRGRRFGGALAKQFLPLAGTPLLVWSARRLATVPDIGSFVVVAAPEEHERCRALLAPLALPLRLADAGAERQHSVASGLAASDERCDIIVVHDAARPLVDDGVIERLLARLAEGVDGVVPGVAIGDTVKRLDRGLVAETIDREALVAVQTPQVFVADRLRAAYSGELAGATDCASLVERAGGRVAVVAGDARLVKVTTADDLELVARLVEDDGS